MDVSYSFTKFEQNLSTNNTITNDTMQSLVYMYNFHKTAYFIKRNKLFCINSKLKK